MPPLIIIVKFAEIALRAVFVILVTYTLKLEEAGQFGIVVTLQGLASFAFGYERYIDLQRRLVGESAEIFDGAIFRAFLFFCGNYVLFSPFFLLALFFVADITGVILALCIAVAIGEHISNLAYHLTLVNSRYKIYLYASFIKTALVLVLICILIFLNSIDLKRVLIVWGCLAGSLTLVTVICWLKTSSFKHTQIKALWNDIASQYNLSGTHFLIGLLAVLSLQLDRLVVGSILSFELTGVYFRHVLISALVYQIFNVGFYSRLVPTIFKAAKTTSADEIALLINRTYFKVLLFIALIFVFVFALGMIGDGVLLNRYSLDILVLSGLILACALRIRADLNALIFNAFYKEKLVLKIQFACVCIGIFLSVILTYVAGLYGTISATILMALIYVTYTYYSLKRLRPDMNNINRASTEDV